MQILRLLTFVFLFHFAINLSGTCQSFKSIKTSAHEVLLTNAQDGKIRIRFYNDHIVRIQTVQAKESFFDDNHYEMVVDHALNGTYTLKEDKEKLTITTKQVIVTLHKPSFSLTFIDKNNKTTLLSNTTFHWENNIITTRFAYDENEHFCGLGHQSYGQVESIDLKGKETNCNYGEGKYSDWMAQAVLTVPFYLSSKGYGVFLNSTFKHSFNFGKEDEYKFSINTKGFEGRMDFFFIYGPDFKTILNHYTYLTGRPRLPALSIFGLQLSDKGEPQNNGEEWWKNKITEHRKAGFAFDHIVKDNRWRAGTGAWSGSWFEWDSTRYPDPKKYNEWIRKNNVTATLDLNRNISKDSWGWKPSYNFPNAEKYIHEGGDAAADYSDPQVRNWVWELFYKKSLNPALDFPGDALWIDETDQMYTLPDSLICKDGRSWAENNNYYTFLIAKAIVQEGWDNENNNYPEGIYNKRPYVWIRGMCAGAQRYATHWTGDLRCDYDWMKGTIRSLQTSGLSGFPFFNHDAGGFRDPGPDDVMYADWAMAMGSFTPIWRPHGIGEHKRWPLDRNIKTQTIALRYTMLRYTLMPYLYSYAHLAHQQGIPIARAMVIEHQQNSQAWKHDLQYYWGSEMIVAPNHTGKDTLLTVWLPESEQWYYYWNDEELKSGIHQHKAKVGELPLFIKAGSIIPQRKYALSTFDLDPKELHLHVYTGKDGEFILYEDDGTSESYRKGALRITRITFSDKTKTLTIHPARGTYTNAPATRSYKIFLHGEKKRMTVLVNRIPVDGGNESSSQFITEIQNSSVDQPLIIQFKTKKASR